MAANAASRGVTVLLAVATGVLTFLAFPDWNIHYLAWFCAVPMLLAARASSVRGAFWIGLLAGAVTNFGGFFWMTGMLREFGHLPTLVTWAILLLQAVTQGLTMAVGLAVWRYLARRGAHDGLSALAGLWLGEAAIPMIFPWFLGNSLSPELPMIQVADLGGVHLVSAVAWAANAALYAAIAALLQGKLPDWKQPLATVAVVGLSLAYGTWRIADIDASQSAAPKLRVGLVEGNVGIWEKEARHLDGRERALTMRHNLLKHQQMSADLEKAGAELIVWPESAYMPYGVLPIVHSLDHFVLVGAGGTLLKDDGASLRAEQPDRLGLPRDLGLLTGLSSPRGDLLRAIDGDRRVLTVTPQGVMVRELPAGETAVATASAPPDWYGQLIDGYVVGRSGRVWSLGWPEAGAQDAPRAVGEGVGLVELRSQLGGQVDLSAAGCAQRGRCIAVGRRGTILGLGEGQVRPEASPTTQDLWAAAGDGEGDALLVAGAGGTILVDEGAGWRAEPQGQKTWFAAWYCPGGSAWVGGEGGKLARRTADGTWHLEPSVDSDVMAGACDADGSVAVVGRGGRVWRKVGTAWVAVAGSARGELTAIVGLQAQASLALPRAARRIVPATAPLPQERNYPRDVLDDSAASEADRSTPRRGFRVPLLFGALSHGKPLKPGPGHCEECYNSAVLLGSKGEIQAIHDKAFLLAFGEYMPLGERFPWLYDLSPETSRFQAGTKTAPIALDVDARRKARLGMLICYEDLLPRYARRVAAHNPNVLVNLTNDAWFLQSAEPEHHLNLALMRAVEYRKWLIRSTNTGISVFIDAAGRRVAETRLTDAETLMRDVPLLEGETIYAALGDWPLLVLGLLVGGLWISGLSGATARPPNPTKRARSARTAKA